MIVVPENKIVIIPDGDRYIESINQIVEPFKGNKKRDWFIQHAYFCLPLVIGNQYGFGIKTLKTFSVIWNGGNSPSDIIVEILDDGGKPEYQSISSHFGMGTVTIQNRFTFRTPPGVNLMTINPPNCWIDGIQHMTGVIETDNLRRDFTFNLKVTCKNTKITIQKGDYIGCVLPIPRYYADGFDLEDAYSIYTKEQIEEEQQAMKDFGKERYYDDSLKKHGNGRRYFKGEDIYGCPFSDHQNKL